MSRRALLQTAGTVAAAAVVGAIADHSLLNPGPAAWSSSANVPGGGRWRPVATLGDLPSGAAIRGRPVVAQTWIREGATRTHCRPCRRANLVAPAREVTPILR